MHLGLGSLVELVNSIMPSEGRKGFKGAEIKRSVSPGFPQGRVRTRVSKRSSGEGLVLVA